MAQLLRAIPPLPSTERGTFCSLSSDKTGNLKRRATVFWRSSPEKWVVLVESVFWRCLTNLFAQGSCLKNNNSHIWHEFRQSDLVSVLCFPLCALKVLLFQFKQRWGKLECLEPIVAICWMQGERLLYCSGSNVIWRPTTALAEGGEKAEEIFCWKGEGDAKLSISFQFPK